jgi:hypothetical protein
LPQNRHNLWPIYAAFQQHTLRKDKPAIPGVAIRTVGGPFGPKFPPGPANRQGTADMTMIQNGYSGVSLLLDLNRDRLFAIGAIAATLSAGAWAASLLG